MKITKRQLRRIIKEEKSKLQEAGLPAEFDDPSAQDIIDGLYNAINQMIWDDWAATGVDLDENPEEVEYAKQALRNLLAMFESGNY